MNENREDVILVWAIVISVVLILLMTHSIVFLEGRNPHKRVDAISAEEK